MVKGDMNVWKCASCGEEEVWSKVELNKKEKRCGVCGRINYIVTVELQLPMKSKSVFGEIVND